MNYRLVRSARKTVSIQITPAGEVVVRCPKRLPEREVRKFVESKRDWIEKHQKKMEQWPKLPVLTEEELRILGQEAARVLPQRVEYFAKIVGVDYGRITIRSQKTRWGSCSAKGNLNFNCLLMLAPEEVLDYVVVHELCHRKELNHSARFWAEVARVLPDYVRRREWLKENGGGLIGRLPH